MELISEEEALQNTANASKVAKKEAFERVTRKFNALGLGEERTYKQLYDAWGRLKKKKKKQVELFCIICSKSF